MNTGREDSTNVNTGREDSTQWGKDSGCNHVIELNDTEDDAALALKHICQRVGHNNCRLLANTIINICLVFQTVTCETESTFGLHIDDNYLM